MSTKDHDSIAAALRYCLNHCDSDNETAMVEWVAEKLAEGCKVSSFLAVAA